MDRIENTVFICCRRTNEDWALAIYQDLTGQGYDVFYDDRRIPAGDYERVITENIKARTHFLIVLTPSGLGRCNSPGDWMWKEIETAMDSQRNLVPLMLEGFYFGLPPTIRYLTGNLTRLSRYNGMRVPVDYFPEAMVRLRERYLDLPLRVVLHPVSAFVRQETLRHKARADGAAKVKMEENAGVAWFEKGYDASDLNEQIYSFTRPAGQDPGYPAAINLQGMGQPASGQYGRGDPGKPTGRGLEDAPYPPVSGPKDAGNRLNWQAITAYTEAIRSKPSPADDHFNRGICYADLGQHRKAIADFTKAIQINPGHRAAYLKRLASYEALRQYDYVLFDFRKVIELDPGEPAAYFARGLFSARMGKWDTAIADINLTIEIDPEQAIPYLARGTIYTGRGKHAQALADYNRAIQLNPSLAVAYLHRGDHHANLGATDRAIVDYNKAIEIDPEFIDAYYHKACVYAGLGKLEPAVRWLREALARDAIKVRQMVRGDRNFDQVRGSDAFKALIAEYSV